MITFLIKSTLSLIVLLVFYYLILENEKMHQFNRFFLLFGVLFSLIIPFLSFEIIQTIPISTVKIGNIQAVALASNPKNNYLEIAVWSIYGVVTLILFIRFFRNIFEIYSKIKSNKIQVFKKAKLVLLNELHLPYTFLNYIFINKIDFENQKIENELFTHGLTHVNDKHSLDILYIEILRIIFWFNPVFYFYRKAIQLNHEFLADSNVISNHNNISFYQTLLINKTSNINYQLASNFSYSLTKKRLIMMTKSTSKTLNFIKKLSVMPIIVGLLLMFCIKTVAQEKKPLKKSTSKGSISKKISKKSLKSIKKDVLINPAQDTIVAVMGEPPANTIEYNKYNSESIHKSDGLILSEQPEFIGGKEAFYKYVGQNYKVPDVAGLKGTIYISFVVETNGTLTDIKCLRDIGFDSGKEAIRVLKASPIWKPGTIDGQPVRCQYQLPIMISSVD